jgi:hypothetical protein
MSLRQGHMPLKPLVKAAELNTFETNLAATAELIKQACSQNCIYSRDLDHELYGHSEIVEALKQFGINKPRQLCANYRTRHSRCKQPSPSAVELGATLAFVIFVSNGCDAGRPSISFNFSG